MAFWESPKSQLGNSKERSFYADSESDVANLPTTLRLYEIVNLSAKLKRNNHDRTNN